MIAAVKHAAGLTPGVLLAAGLAAAAFALRLLPGLAGVSVLMMAIVLGVVWRNAAGASPVAQPGIAFCLRTPLRFGIVLLGLQLTIADMLEVGVAGVLTIVTCVVATYAFTVSLGRLLGVDARLAQLIGAGTAICGAAAIMAVNAAVRDRDYGVAYAIGVVTLFGTCAMILYPVLGSLMSLSAHHYGLWVGASVHEVAQAVAAGFARGEAAGQFGTMAKLTRVIALAPMVLALAWTTRGTEIGLRRGSARAPVPWFVAGFLAMVAVASLGVISPAVQDDLMLITQIVLAIALAAVGLETDLRHVAAQGWRAITLGAAATVFLSGLSLALVLLFVEA